MPYYVTHSVGLILMSVAISGCLSTTDAPSGGPMVLVSSHDGGHGNGRSYRASVDADGSNIAFSTSSTNLVTGGPSCQPEEGWDSCQSILLWTETSRTFDIVSAHPEVPRFHGDSKDSVISGNGRFVAFFTWASNLPDEGETFRELYVKDLEDGSLLWVSSPRNSEGDERTKDLCAAFCGVPSITHDGRFAVFDSARDDLVAEDENSRADVFVFDRELDEIERVSVGEHGEAANDSSWIPTSQAISDGGRFIVFQSRATNLVEMEVPGDRTLSYLHDRQTGRNILIPEGRPLPRSGGINLPVISSDGLAVAFVAPAELFDRGGVPGPQVGVWYRNTDEVVMISQNSAGDMANGDSWLPTINHDGSRIAFSSRATNLDPRDEDGDVDIYLWDRSVGHAKVISVGEDGRSGEGTSTSPHISADGRTVVFRSERAALWGGSGLVPSQIVMWNDDGT